MAQRTSQGASTLSQAAGGERLPTLPIVLAYVQACGGDLEEWEERWREVAAEEAAQPRLPDAGAEPPYRGLARFEADDADLFFGRDKLTDRLLELTRSRRFTAVFGPSGSGKSSLLRAGLIPRLRSPGTTGPWPAAVRVLTPGEHPLRVHEQRLLPKDADGDTWLIVDQFEELYTLCTDPAERDQFIDRLLAATDAASHLRVAIAVRADFLGRCAEHPALTAALQDGTVLVGPMSRDELREAIIKPAQAAGMIVERALTARILDEVEGEPGALPLMSHALLETWRRRKGRALTTQVYEAAGGLHGAIARTAEDVHTQLTPSQAALARRILLRLITPGEGMPDTRRPASRTELDFGDPDDTAQVIEHLARARLLTLEHDTVDLAHEALITAWPRLRQWINEARDLLRLHRQLTEAARTWDNLNRDPGALYRGARLASAEEAFASERSVGLTPVEKDFLSASRVGRSKERRRLRTFVTSLSLLLALALIAGTIAWQQNRENDRRQEEAAARRIASLASSLRSTDPALAMRLSVAAWRISANTDTSAALFAASTQQERDSFAIPEQPADGNTFLSGDGRTLVITGGNRVRRWDVRTRRPAGSFPQVDDGLGIDISSDARELLVGNLLPNSLQVRDLMSGKSIGRPFQLAWSDAKLSPNGRTLLIEGEKSVELWNIRSHRLLLKRQITDLQQAIVSPDDRFVAICTNSGSFEVWDVLNRRQVHAAWVKVARQSACDGFMAFGTGDLLAMPTDDGVRIWNTATGRRLPGISTDVQSEVTFSVDGRYLAVVGDGDVTLWCMKGPQRRILRYDFSAEVGGTPNAVGASSNVRVDAKEGVVRYLTASTVNTVAFDTGADSDWHRDTNYQARFSPDGRFLATARLDGNTVTFELRKTTGNRRTKLLPGRCQSAEDSGCTVHMTFSPDGRTFAYGTSPAVQSSHQWPERIRLWDTGENHEISLLDLTDKGRNPSNVSGILLGPDDHSLLTYRMRAEGESEWEQWSLRSASRIWRRTVPEHAEIGLPFGDTDEPLALRPDGRLLATVYSKLVALPSGRWTGRALSRDGVPTQLQFSPSGDRLAVGDDAGWVFLWDNEGRRRLARLAAGTQDAEAVSALAFSPDGSLLAVGGKEGTVRLWDVVSAQPLGSTMSTASDAIRALSFSRDGRTLQIAGEHIPLRTQATDLGRVATAVCKRAGGGLTHEQWETYLPELPYRDICWPQ
ncbi:hypothetical protein [Streptomyces sp. NPDC001604]|uniref:nSTAND1 domain-containing NTPase n=1 Tax=Streptomyces sp. NPDC001604 TaxID=3364593 RepID=UPI0036BA44D3